MSNNYKLYSSTSGIKHAGRLFLNSWILVAMFLVMAFNCNLRACLVKTDFEKPIGTRDKQSV